ncbi:siderophore-interacting protein [Xanthomonas massiliensis]|uniref:siderophore-interacting protein n=1 Tax=Xanthomonas massiliensis TaxID=1720302 RepID=UPI0008267AAE|nr:siderophore-interacting protein [Xanthomonas massiliensis]
MDERRRGRGSGPRLLTLHGHCTRLEQRLVRALRNLAGGSEASEQGARALLALGIAAEDVWAFARLSRLLAHAAPAIALHGPDSPFVSADELGVVAALQRALRRGPAAAGGPGPAVALAGAFDACAGALRRADVSLGPRRSVLAGQRRLEDERVDLAAAPGHRRLAARVAGTSRLSPHVRRLTLAGEALRELDIRKPGQWVKLFVPVPGAAPGDTVGRAYTVRRHRAAAGELDIDIVLHGGDGPLSRWAERAQAGDALALAGPRGGYAIDPGHDWLLLAGDAAGLPAIAAIVEAAPARLPIRVLLALPEREDECALPHRANVSMATTVASQPGDGALLARLAGHPLPAGRGAIWIAADATTAQRAREHLARVLPSRPGARIGAHCVGHWKPGVRDHRDAAAG